MIHAELQEHKIYTNTDANMTKTHIHISTHPAQKEGSKSLCLLEERKGEERKKEEGGENS